MIALFKRLLTFSGDQKGLLLRSFLFHVISSVFEMVPILAILTVLEEVLAKQQGKLISADTIRKSFAIMMVSILGRIVFINLSANARTFGSFSVCTKKRLIIGERLKHAPMGYFSENRLGDITAAVTTTLGDIESNAVMIMESVAGGFIHAIVITSWLFFYERRIGLLSLAGLLAALLVYADIQKVSKKHSPRRQAAQAALVAAVLEYVQGMGVVKAFGLDGHAAQTMNQSIEESASANIKLEKAFSTMTGWYQTVFKLARAAVLVFAPYLLWTGEISAEKCLLLLVSSFMIYSAVEVAGSMSSVARLVDASLDRMEKIMAIPSLDENGSNLSPVQHDIEVRHVSFGYGEKEVLHDVSFTVPEGSSCAIVGPSGSGKTTLCSLLARFWDVNSGQILLGGHDVRTYTSDSLLRNFSIVFQNVYHVSAQTYSYIFGVNGIGLLLTGALTGRLAGHIAEWKLLRVALTAAFSGSLVLLAGFIMHAPLFVIAVTIFITVSTLSAMGSASFSLAMQKQGKSAGGAAALIGFFSLVSGAVMAPVVGIGGSDTALPMGIIIVVGEAGALLMFYKFIYIHHKDEHKDEA